MIDNAKYRFGSANTASLKAIKRAGMFKKHPNSLLIGFMDKRPLFYNGAGGLLMVAGARSGKMRDVLAYNLCAGVYSQTMLMLDLKGEGAAISQNQTPDRKYCIYWNAAFLHNLPCHRINPVDYLRKDSPTLGADIKVFCETIIATSGSAQSIYFEGRSREYLEAIIHVLVEKNGVLTLPDLYHVLNRLVGNGEDWLDFAFLMSKSDNDLTVRVEEEIAESREDSTGGFRGIIGELLKAFACLSDPALMASVSPPYDFSLKQLCESDQTYNFYMMPPAEFVEAWSPIIKAMFTGAMLYKSRAPQAPQQTWIIDEAAQLQKFPLLLRMFTYGAGIGIRPWAIFQSTQQMAAIGNNAENILTSSAQLRSYFGVRDYSTACTLSDMIGVETLEYQDGQRALQARHAKTQALQAVISGENPLKAALQIRQQQEMAGLQPKQHRQLRTPDEVLGMPADQQYIFADGVRHVIEANRKPYYEQRFMVGRFHPNPYHPPLDKVRVKTLMRHAWRSVITEPVPTSFAHYPQYQDGTWSRIAA